MQQARGYKTKLVMDQETSFGVSPLTKKGMALPFNKLDLKSEQTIINPSTISGTRNAVEPARGHIAVAGSVTIPIDTSAFGYWLKGIFNSPTSTHDEGTGKYTHVFKVSDSQPSFVIDKEFPDVGQYFSYSGVKVNSFKATFGDDGELTADMDLLGKDEVISSSAYDSAATDVTLKRVNNFQAVLKENDVITASIKTMDLELKMGLDDSQYVLGSKGRGDIPEGLIEVSGTMKALFNDSALLQKGIDATETKIELILTSGTNSLTFLLPEVQYERTSPTIEGPAGVEAEFKFSAYFNDSTEKSSIIVTLVNDTEKY